jgi:hypothetical protein
MKKRQIVATSTSDVDLSTSILTANSVANITFLDKNNTVQMGGFS